MHFMHSNMHNMHDAIAPPAEIIRRARKARSLSQHAFGELFERSQGVVSRYESGQVAPPAEVLMRCMHMLAPSDAAAPTALDPAITGVRQALDALGRALDDLQRVAVSVRDTPPLDDSHSPATGEGSRP